MYRYQAKKSPLRSALTRLLCASLVLSSFPAGAQAARIGSQAVIPVAPKSIGVSLGGSIPLLQGPNMVGGVAQLRDLTALPLSVSAQASLGFIVGPALIPVAATQETSDKSLNLPSSQIPVLSGLERAVESKFYGERFFDSVGRSFSAASSGVVPPVPDNNNTHGRPKSGGIRNLVKDHPEALKWLGPAAQAHPEVLDWLGPVAQANPEVLKFIGPVAMSHPEVLKFIGPVAMSHPEALKWLGPVAQAHPEVLEWIGPAAQAHPEVLDWLGPAAQAHPEVLEWIGPAAQAHPEVLDWIGPVAQAHPEVLEWIGPTAQAHPEVLRFKIPYAWTAKEPLGQKKISVLFRHWIGPIGIFVSGAACIASIYFGIYPLVLIFAIIGVMCEVVMKSLYMRKP